MVSILVAIVLLLPSLVLIPRQYTARLTVMFPVSESDLAALAAPTMGFQISVPEGGSLSSLAYVAVLSSRRAQLLAAQRCGVAEFYNLEDKYETLRWMNDSVSAVLGPDRLLAVHVRTTGTPLVTWLFNPQQQRDRAARELAAAIATELVNTMAEIAETIEIDRTKSNVTALEKRLGVEEQKLDSLDEIEKPKPLRPVADDLASFHTQLLAEVLKAENQLDAAKNDVKRLEASLQATRAATADQLKSLGELPAETPLLAAARAAYSQARAAHEDVAAQYGPENARVVAAAATLRRAEMQLRQQAAQVANGQLAQQIDLEISLAGAKSLQQGLQRRQNDLNARADKLAKALPTERKLNRDALAQEQAVLALRKDVLQAEVVHLKSGVRWFVLDPADVPRWPSGPSMLLALTAALLGAVATYAAPWMLALQKSWLSTPE